MMHPLCLSVVEKSIKDKKTDIQNIIRNLCTTDSPEPRFPDLVKEHAPFNDHIVNPDCRIDYLKFSCFRTYPKRERYGLSFKDDKDRPSSLFLIGNNGSGKSTLFTALEKIYTGTSSYAAKMTDDEDSYLTFGFGQMLSTSEKSWSLIYKLHNGQQENLINSSVSSELLAVPAFFCSDLDIQAMKEDKNLFHWILKQMGYERLEEGIKKISSLRKKRKEIINGEVTEFSLTPEEYSDLMKALIDYEPSKHEEELKLYSSSLETIKNPTVPHHLFQTQWDEIERLEKLPSHRDLGHVILLDNHESVPLHIREIYESLFKLYKRLAKEVNNIKEGESKIETILLLGQEQKKVIEEQSKIGVELSQDTEANIGLLEEAETILKNIQNELVRDFLDRYGMGVLNILSEFSNHGEKYEFINTNNLSSLDVLITAHLGGGYQTTPHLYFNEFRFKLYCVTMKIAIAYHWMVKNHVSVPIVIDDIFNASDFENSIKLEDYAYFIKKTYNDQVLKNGFEKELQLILLSHDQLVIESFRRGYLGLSLKDLHSMRNDDFPLIVGRIYRLEEIGEYNSSLKNQNGYKSIYNSLNNGRK